jgi:hypothetical protein
MNLDQQDCECRNCRCSVQVTSGTCDACYGWSCPPMTEYNRKFTLLRDLFAAASVAGIRLA